MDQLQELGYNREDCGKALRVAKDNVDEAALWLLDNAKLVKQKEENKITAIVVSTGVVVGGVWDGGWGQVLGRGKGGYQCILLRGNP